jgi:hypothetical protein
MFNIVSEPDFMKRGLISNTNFHGSNFEKIFVQFLQSSILFSFLLHSGFLCLLIMAAKKDDSFQSVSVRLDGKNCSYWSYVTGILLRVKRCGDILVELL